MTRRNLAALLLLVLASTPCIANEKVHCAAQASAAAPAPVIQTPLQALIADHGFVIPAAAAQAAARRMGITVEALMVRLLGEAKPLARPAVSHFHVGAVGLAAATGDLVLGVNLEFPKLSPTETVHAEQFVVALTRIQNLGPLSAIASSSTPCGSCRQYLYETKHGGSMLVHVPGHPVETIGALLPRAFGPQDLDVQASLLSLEREHPRFQSAAPRRGSPFERLITPAVEAAQDAYTPYTRTAAAVALEGPGGFVVSGSSIENAAFNPTLGPLQVALTKWVASGLPYDDIQRAVLAEADGPISFEDSTKSILRRIAPGAKFKAVLIRPRP